MKVIPLMDRLLVKRIESLEKTEGGLYIPDSAKEKPQRGLVVAVGDGRFLDDGKKVPLTVEAGQEVYFGKYAGNEIKIDGEEHLILREDDVLGIVVE
jgi:chaperonin GroES